uniref:Uncharacterized protein n=1 Tax=Vespula pensylvanica TaxID=30213 RepID=A0A834N2D4_VESPE|nr:hypothetical protein H0235_017478 [Vespula pensylvanica]
MKYKKIPKDYDGDNEKQGEIRKDLKRFYDVDIADNDNISKRFQGDKGSYIPYYFGLWKISHISNHQL